MRKSILYIVTISFFFIGKGCVTNEPPCCFKSEIPVDANCKIAKANNDTTSIIILKPTSGVVDSLRKLGLNKIDSCNCDLDLQLWGTNGQRIIGNDGFVKSSNGSGGGAGDELQKLLKKNGILFSPNYKLSTDPMPTDSLIKLDLPDSLANNDHVIGIIDSGIYSSKLWRNPQEEDGLPRNDDDTNGFEDDLNGWNFLNDNNQVLNYGVSNWHGTNVAYFLRRSIPHEIKNYSILPMVVLNKNNEGYLFDLVCALAYSLKLKDNGVNIEIINASVSYYGYGSNVLEEYVCKLKDEKIYLIASAGNQADGSDCYNRDQQNLSNRTLKSYPACLSKHYYNVKGITTISDKVENEYQIAGNQKYSNEYVDLGVESDLSDGGADFELIDGSKGSGSSYAAPVATAYYFLKNNNIPMNNFKYKFIQSSSLKTRTKQGNALVSSHER